MSVLAGSGLLILILLCVIGVEVLIGVMVYRDAKARGMEPWLGRQSAYWCRTSSG